MKIVEYNFCLISIIVILLRLSYQIDHVLAAYIEPGMIIYTEEASCPNGYTEIDSSKRGVAILCSLGGPYAVVQGSQYTTATTRTHSHIISSLCIAEEIPAAYSANISGNRVSMRSVSENRVCGFTTYTSYASSGYAFAFLRACAATSSSTGQVPINTVAHFDSSVESCPSGWRKYTEANGRFIVPLSATQQALSITVTSNASEMRSLYGPSNAGAHTHFLNTTYKFPGTTFSSCCDGSPMIHAEVGDKEWPVTGFTESANALQEEVPWVGLLTCIATDDATPTGKRRPPQGSIIYMASSSCGQGYERIDSKYDGRIILTNPTDQISGTTFGGTPFNPPYGVIHTHSVNNAKLDCMISTWSDDDSNGSKKLYKGMLAHLSAFESEASDPGLPYIAIALCRPLSLTNSSTDAPTQVPTDVPSLHPTRNPTKYPTITPTTLHPTSNPTPIPTTGTPTNTPTKNPTKNPTTLPSIAPTFKCSSSDKYNWESNGGQETVLTDLDTCSKTTTCGDDLLQEGHEQAAIFCTKKCLATIAYVNSIPYTDTCTTCIAEFAVCQYTQCDDCKKGRTKKVCVECTKESSCITAFKTCSGSIDMVVNIENDTEILDAANSTALIAGSIGGAIGFIGLSVAVFMFCFKRSNQISGANNQSTLPVALQIDADGLDYVPEAMPVDQHKE